jgi:hypothetical protein
MQIRHDSILTLELPYRERLALRRTVFYGGHGPKVAVLAGVHGDELEGLYVCHRLAVWLQDLAATRPEALLGRVELFPAMNPLGLDTLKRLVPVYETDLNRNFPGHAEGPLPQPPPSGMPGKPMPARILSCVRGMLTTYNCPTANSSSAPWSSFCSAPTSYRACRWWGSLKKMSTFSAQGKRLASWLIPLGYSSPAWKSAAGYRPATSSGASMMASTASSALRSRRRSPAC